MEIALSVAEAIKAIRLRLKEPMRTFALRLGVRHSTVSMYESSKLTPSRSMLILLFQLAATAEEKNAILDGMGVDPNLRSGWGEGELIEAVKAFDVFEKAKEIEAKEPRRPWKKGSLVDFAEKATIIVKEIKDVDPCLVDFLSAWINFHDNPQALEDFRDVVSFLSMRLGKLQTEGDRKKAKKTRA